MKAGGRGVTETASQVDVQLMPQLCSKDSPAVPGISLCAYVIRIHGTGARPGASDPATMWSVVGQEDWRMTGDAAGG